MGCGPSLSAHTPPNISTSLDFDKLENVIGNEVVLGRLRCLGPEQRYTDPEFFGLSALYMDGDTTTDDRAQMIEWKRPSELVECPQLFVDGASHLDIVQGDLGDCWFLCSCAAVTLKPEIWNKVIPADNKLFNHKGLYHFCFWRFGHWIDIYVDDLLPTKDGQFIYAQASDPSEIWPALIEKAYAKVNGCYEALQSGKASEGLLDLTGGLTEVYYPPQMEGKELFEVIRQALRNGAFLACNTDNEHDGSRGLITGHAYSITKACKVPSQKGTKDLLRIFNPWGGTEWDGDWSDLSPTWNTVPTEVRNALNMKQATDGEFWMGYEDFCQHFVRVYICTLGPDFDMDGVVDKNKMFSFHGEWKPGKSAGGCSDDPEKYAMNPQYTFSIDIDKEVTAKSCETMRSDMVVKNRDKGVFMIVSLMQKYERSFKKKNPRSTEEYINFRIYKIENTTHTGHFRPTFFEEIDWIEPILGEVDYTNTREVTSRFLLDPGHYVLVPSTFDPDISASFLLRMYAWTSDFECSIGTDAGTLGPIPIEYISRWIVEVVKRAYDRADLDHDQDNANEV